MIQQKFLDWWHDDEKVVTDISVYVGIISVLSFIIGIIGVMHFH